MSDFLEKFVDELEKRFHLVGLRDMESPEKVVLLDIGRRCAKTFWEDEKV